MDAKKTLGIGLVALLVGLVWAWKARWAVAIVLGGGFALVVLLAGVLFTLMGYLQVKEDRARAAQEARDAAQQAAQAASA